MFGDDLKGELFNKIGTQSAGNPEELLTKAENELKDGDPLEAKKILKELISITSINATRYDNQSQHRASAQEYYIQAIAYEMMQQTEERDTNYSKVVDGLLKYAKNAITFDENEKGVTSATLAGLVCVVSGNNNRAFEIYNNHMAMIKGKQNFQSLTQIMHSLGYLLDALKNTNVTALSDAQNFISKDLSPILVSAKLTGFNKLLNSVVKFAQDVIESRIKMPKLQLITNIPKDILFNDIFEVSVEINNSGEGEAHAIEFNLQIAEELELVNGDKQVIFDKMEPNSKEKLNFSLRYQTGQTTNEVIMFIKGNLIYLDMLNNGHKQYFGPLEFEIRAISRTSEYQEKLKQVMADYEKIEFDNLDEIIQLLVPSMRQIYNTFVETIAEYIKVQAFQKADLGFELLDNLIVFQKNVLFGDDLSTSLISNIKSQIESAENVLSENLKQEFIEEKKQALESLEKEKNTERDESINKVKSELNEKHDKVISTLKEENFKEMGRINQTHENKLQKHLADLEQTLENKFVQEMNSKSDEFEKTLRDLRTQYDSELDEERSKIRSELKEKYEKEIDELKTSKNEEIRKINEANEENLLNSLATQKTKLETIKTEELEALRRDLKTELTQKFDAEMDDNKKKSHKELSDKNQLIDDLERQIRDLKSSSE